MAGIVESLKLQGRVLGAGFIWANVSIPAVGSRLLVAANANGIITPDATTNPLAFPIGATKAGAKASLKVTEKDVFVDETPAAVDVVIEQVSMAIAAEIHAIADKDNAKLALSGIATQTVTTGFVDNKIGYTDPIFSSVVLIAPLRDDPTQVLVFQEYRAKNSEGLEFSTMRTEMSGSPMNFKAYAVATRPKTDQLGNFYWTTT